MKNLLRRLGRSPSSDGSGRQTGTPDSCPPATTDRPCAGAAPGRRQLATAPAATPPQPAAPPAAAPAALTGPLLDCLFSDDAEAAAAAAERLCELAKGDTAVQAALGANPRLTSHLRIQLSGGGAGSGGPAAERLQMYAAYLVSVLAGKSAATDAALLDQRLLPALVTAAGSAAAAAGAGACGWGVARGALRAVAKLMEAQPACAAAQLLACGGAQQVASMLDAEDTGVVRRCLSILLTAAATSPGGAAAVGLLQPAALAALVRLLASRLAGSSSSTEVEAEAASLLLAISREPGAAQALAAVGAGPMLTVLAASSGSSEAGRLAGEALQHLQQQVGWRQLQLHSTDSAGTPGTEFSRPGLRSLHGMPSPARRQLSSGGQQPPRHRPPLPIGRPASGASSTRSHAVLRAQQAEQAQQHAGLQFWRPESAASSELASPFGRATSGVSDAFASELGSGGAGDLRSAGSGGLAAAAAAERATSQGSGGSDSLHVQRSDIVICQTAEGRELRLGEGGFGVVYKGLMHGVDEVAVKRIKATAPTADAELATFHREASLLSRLHHRNIVQYYGACFEPGSLMIVTELMKGGDLYTAMRRHPDAMRWERLGRKVALDVALGLNYLHSRRPPMSHRDLKSPNVLLSEEGVAKIGDVGMLRPQTSALMTAEPRMTPLWAAPEVLRYERVGVKADIWSYGVLVWEIASGQDITRYAPLALSRLGSSGGKEEGGGRAARPAFAMPPTAPQLARHIFATCTQMDPDLRPNAAQLVEWLRGGKVCSCCAV